MPVSPFEKGGLRGICAKIPLHLPCGSALLTVNWLDRKETFDLYPIIEYHDFQLKLIGGFRETNSRIAKYGKEKGYLPQSVLIK